MLKYLIVFSVFFLIATGSIAQDNDFVFVDCNSCSDTLMYTYKNDTLPGSDDYYQKAGYYNRKGELVIPRIYDHATQLINGQAIVGIGGRYGVIDVHGKFIVPMKYSEMHLADYIGYRATQGELNGILDHKGNELIPVIYEDVRFWKDSIFRITDKGKIGLYDSRSHKWLMQPRYKDIYEYNNTILAYISADKVHWVNASDYSMIDSTYEGIGSFNKSMYIVHKNNLWGIVDERNNIRIPLKYQALANLDFSDLIVATQHGQKGLITIDDQILQDFVYDGIYSSSAQLKWIIVIKNNLYGMLNASGTKLIIPCMYKSIKTENKDSIFVKDVNDLYGIIAKDGTVIENCVYDFHNQEYRFSNPNRHNHIYSKGNKFGLFDFSKMSFQTKPEFDEIKMIDVSYWSSQYLACKGKEKIMYNERGALLFRVTGFEDIIPTSRGNVYIAVKNKKYGLIDDKGKMLMPCMYELILADNSYMLYALDKGRYYQLDLRGATEFNFAPCK